MKKKLVMRIASLALCVVFVGMLFGAPKAEAVAAEATAVAIGVAVLGSYVAATQLRFTGDVADTISNGITSLVSDWVEASAVAASADDWLANLGNATQMTSPGMLQLQGAFARGCANFVAWLTETFGLDEEGSDVPVYEAPAFAFADGSPVLLFDQSLGNYSDASFFDAGTVYALSNGTTVEFVFKNSGYLDFSIIDSSGSLTSGRVGGSLWSKYTFDGGALADAGSGSVYVYVHWFDSASSKSGWLTDNKKYSLGAISSGEVSVVREEGFANPAVDAADDDNLTIITGLTSPTLSNLAVDVPAQIAAGEFAPTVELTLAGEGAEDPAVPDDSTVVPGVTPWLESIFNVTKGIADRIVNGVKGLFVPDQTSVDSFSDVVDAKLPFIGTLQEFGDDFAYKLEHPEECANGLGLTTVVDLGKGRGSYLGTTKHDLLDVSWYLEYKPMVDDIIVGFCWLCFLWNCYGALPRIIHGEGSIAGAISILREEDGDL